MTSILALEHGISRCRSRVYRSHPPFLVVAASLASMLLRYVCPRLAPPVNSLTPIRLFRIFLHNLVISSVCRHELPGRKPNKAITNYGDSTA